MERARIDIHPARLVPLRGGSPEVLLLVGDGRIAAFNPTRLDPLWSEPLQQDAAAVRACSTVVHAEPGSATALLVRGATTGAVAARLELPSPLSSCEEASESPMAMRAAAKAIALVAATSQRRGLPQPWRGDTILKADGDCVVACCGSSLLVVDLEPGRVTGLVPRPPASEIFRVWGRSRLAVAYGFSAPLTLLDLETAEVRWSLPELIPLYASGDFIIASRTDSGSRRREVLRVDLRSGRVQENWRLEAGGIAFARLTERGFIVTTSGARAVAALDPAGGVAWNVDVGFVTDLEVVGPVVYAAVGPAQLAVDRVIALDATTGKLLWSWVAESEDEDPMEASLVAVEHGVIVALWSDPAGTQLVRLG